MAVYYWYNLYFGKPVGAYTLSRKVHIAEIKQRDSSHSFGMTDSLFCHLERSERSHQINIIPHYETLPPVYRL